MKIIFAFNYDVNNRNFKKINLCVANVFLAISFGPGKSEILIVDLGRCFQYKINSNGVLRKWDLLDDWVEIQLKYSPKMGACTLKNFELLDAN